MLCNFTRLAALVFSFFAANVKAKNQSKSKSFPILIKISLIYFAFLVKFPKFFTKIKQVAVLVFSFFAAKCISEKSIKIKVVSDFD